MVLKLTRWLAALKSMLYTQAIIIVRIKELNVSDDELAGESNCFLRFSYRVQESKRVASW